MQGNDSEIDHFKHLCRQTGLKVTHQRLEIYGELLLADDHPSAESLYARLAARLPTLSLDTVYRTLATFEEMLLVQRIETNDHQARFEAKKVKHHHFLCQQCGRISDFFWPMFDELRLPEEVGSLGRAVEKNVVVHGLCRSCTLQER